MRPGVLAGLLLLSGCGRSLAELPYDVSRVAPADAPHHPLVVAVVRLEDARKPSEAPDSNGAFIYQGVEYRGTVLDALGLDPLREVTLAVAGHLARARVFKTVKVVARPDQATDADLYLTGALVRLRGYVEAHPPESDSGRSADERRVVAEVHLRDLALRAEPEGPVLARFDVGFSFHDVRSARPEPPDPWAIAAEVLAPALDQLVLAARRATLDGSVGVGSTALVAVDPRPFETGGTGQDDIARALSAMSPPGWAFSRTSTAAAPPGWDARPGACSAGAWRSGQEHGFHRMLGPYIPAVEVWWCEEAVGLSFSVKDDYPAFYLGRDPAGRRWLGRQLGGSSWRGALEAFAEAAALSRPAARHLFELGPGPEDRGPGRPQSPLPRASGRP